MYVRYYIYLATGSQYCDLNLPQKYMPLQTACEWVGKQLGKCCGLGKTEEAEGQKQAAQSSQNGGTAYDKKQENRNQAEERAYRSLEGNSYEQYG